MGGYGSGWPIWKDKKTPVEDCREIDVLELYRDDLLDWDRHWHGSLRWIDVATEEVTSRIGLEIDTRDRGAPWVRLHYHFTTGANAGEDIDYRVRLSTTPLHFGGEQWWMHCPVKGCGRRVRKLYLPPRGTYYACRHCHDLTYRSCQESDKRIGRLLDRFGGDPLAVLNAANAGDVDLILALKATGDIWGDKW
jgi:hypothetical protein